MTSSDPITETLVRADAAYVAGDVSRLSAEQTSTLTRALGRVAEGDETSVAAVAHILDDQLRLPVYRLDAAKKAVDNLAAKARERGLPEPSLTEVSRETVGEGDEAEEWVTVRLLGAAPVLGGWRCVAALAIHTINDKQVVDTFAAPQDPRVPLDNRRAAGYAVKHAAKNPTRCEHCGTNRRRVLTYVLQHKGGRTVQVGSTCVNDFLGTDALRAWFIFSRLHELRTELSGWSEFVSADYYIWLAENGTPPVRGTASVDRPVPLVYFLAACSAEIRVHGYLTAGKARGTDQEPTGRKVHRLWQTAEHEVPTSADLEDAKQVEAWLDSDVRGTEEYDAYGEPRYLTSLSWSFTAAARDGVSLASANMLASALGAYRRAMAQRAEQATYKDEHVPGVDEGDRVVLDLTVDRHLGWGLSCVDSQRRVVLVPTTDYADGTERSLAKGSTIRVVGRIRDLTGYRGLAQTRMHYAKVYAAGSQHKSVVKAQQAWTKQGKAPTWKDSDVS